MILTEYELPRPDLTEPHDVVVDPKGTGTVWYSNFGEQSLGELDPKTGKVTEYPLPLLKPDAPTGSLNLEFDPAGNPWVAMMYQQAVATLDRNTGKVTTYPLAVEHQNPKVQIGMLDPRNSNVDGKVWFSEGGSRTLFRLDPKTGTMEQIDQFRSVPKNVAHAEYGIVSDAQNNIWFFDFADRNVRAHRQEHRRHHAVRGADRGLAAAPRPHGCRRPHHLRGVRGRPRRRDGHQDRAD